VSRWRKQLPARLRYERVDREQIDAFHSLIQNEYVRRYLLDGQVLPREWTEQQIRNSQELFQQRGVGIWLTYEAVSNELLGFCGFVVFPSLHPEPQLVYAVLERFSGHGYATEMAMESISRARAQGFTEIIAGADDVNAASVRILEKLGFERISTYQGAFGDALIARLR
jgi:RimJ/RimL family protein N-acetyltransferase